MAHVHFISNRQVIYLDFGGFPSFHENLIAWKIKTWEDHFFARDFTILFSFVLGLFESHLLLKSLAWEMLETNAELSIQLERVANHQNFLL